MELFESAEILFKVLAVFKALAKKGSGVTKILTINYKKMSFNISIERTA